MEAYEIVGSNPSPFSRKLRAILRYRRLPHVWRQRRAGMEAAIESLRPQLVPILGIPSEIPQDGSLRYAVDSTPLAYELEARHPDRRSIVPPGAAAAFVCHLLEDFADEWCMQMMYYYRWIEEETGRFAARWILFERMPEAGAELRDRLEREVATRQRSRLAFVCGDGEGAVIEDSFLSLLETLGPWVSSSRFLFGSRPSLADFALYGQLAQLCTDPLPQGIVRRVAPRVETWVMALEDASGLEGDWRMDDDEAARMRGQLLAMAARSYFPFMQANAAAFEAGRDVFEVDIGGRSYRRAPFGYQAKCYAEVLRRWRELGEASREQIRPALDAAGCLGFLEAL